MEMEMRNSPCKFKSMAQFRRVVALTSSIVITRVHHSTRKSDSEGRYKFSEAQLFVPSKPYPEWDSNWDFRDDKLDEDANVGPFEKTRTINRHRHIILVRHGQYDESASHDDGALLTPLGRLQAEATGLRLAELLSTVNPANIRLHVSNMTRAKETAAILASKLSSAVEKKSPNPLLNEGKPAHILPDNGTKSEPRFKPSTVFRDGARIEAGFRDIFFRAKSHKNPLGDGQGVSEDVHEYDIVVCHANVIRFMTLRALQLPPEVLCLSDHLEN
jgi:serine/threonine-protein phosphatase PGAM5